MIARRELQYGPSKTTGTGTRKKEKLKEEANIRTGVTWKFQENGDPHLEYYGRQ